MGGIVRYLWDYTERRYVPNPVYVYVPQEGEWYVGYSEWGGGYDPSIVSVEREKVIESIAELWGENKAEEIVEEIEKGEAWDYEVYDLTEAYQDEVKAWIEQTLGYLEQAGKYLTDEEKEKVKVSELGELLEKKAEMETDPKKQANLENPVKIWRNDDTYNGLVEDLKKALERWNDTAYRDVAVRRFVNIAWENSDDLIFTDPEPIYDEFIDLPDYEPIRVYYSPQEYIDDGEALLTDEEDRVLEKLGYDGQKQNGGRGR